MNEEVVKSVKFEDIQRAALSGGEMPEGLSPVQTILFFALSGLHTEFELKVIGKFEAHARKLQILKAYSAAEQSYRIYQQTAQMRNQLSEYLADIEKNGCEKCRLAVRIFDGRAKEKNYRWDMNRILEPAPQAER